LEIGEEGPAGGVIFYVADGQGGRPFGFTMTDDNSTAYYLAWTSNETSSGWGDGGGPPHTLVENITTFEDESDLKATIIGNGRKDTQIIVAHMESEGITNTAAQRCAGAIHGTYNDWFLPSLGELKELYKANDLLNVVSMPDFYWSSSQADDVDAWQQSFFSDMEPNANGKHGASSVRAIRAF